MHTKGIFTVVDGKVNVIIFGETGSTEETYSFNWEEDSLSLTINGNVLKTLANIVEIEILMDEFTQLEHIPSVEEFVKVLKQHGYAQVETEQIHL